MDLVTFCLEALNHESDSEEPIVIDLKLIKVPVLGRYLSIRQAG